MSHDKSRDVNYEAVVFNEHSAGDWPDWYKEITVTNHKLPSMSVSLNRIKCHALLIQHTLPPPPFHPQSNLQKTTSSQPVYIAFLSLPERPELR